MIISFWAASSQNCSKSNWCWTRPEAGFPCTWFCGHVSAKEICISMHAGNVSAESWEFAWSSLGISLSSQVQGHAHACCIGIGNTRREKSLIERHFRTRVKYRQAEMHSWKWWPINGLERLFRSWKYAHGSQPENCSTGHSSVFHTCQMD